jgi:hypothetical protein
VIGTGTPLGTDRHGDPLVSLDPALARLREAIAETQHAYWRLTGLLSAPIGAKWSKRRCEPRTGDLVYVVDALRHPDPDTRQKGFGYLVVAREEEMYDDETWERIKNQFRDDGPPPREPIFYVQYGPDPEDVCRWSNASCFAVATEAIMQELKA